jgi:hypothetical protein
MKTNEGNNDPHKYIAFIRQKAKLVSDLIDPFIC